LERFSPWGSRFDAVQVNWAPFPSTALDLQDAIDRDYFACGCFAGRLALAVTGLAAAVFAFSSPQPASTWPAETWILAASALVLIPLMTMLFAIVRSRLRLSAVLRKARAASHRH
jgi:hypothetical protein